jgi:hypothetical protein
VIQDGKLIIKILKKLRYSVDMCGFCLYLYKLGIDSIQKGQWVSVLLAICEIERGLARAKRTVPMVLT